MTLLDDYVARTPRSRELFERATASLPGGSTRTTVYTAPYPPYVASGSGLWLEDVDGNRYRDFLGNYTSLILGHAHPAVVAAVEAQVRRGSAFAAPTETEVELAEEIRRRRPLDRAPAVHELRHRGDDVRDPGRPRVHRPVAHREVRALVPRHPRRGHGRLARACPRRWPGSSSSCRGAIRMASRRPCAAARATSRRSSSSPSRAPAGSARRSRRSCPSCATSPTGPARCSSSTRSSRSGSAPAARRSASASGRT